MSKAATLLRKDVIGWSLYDFANTIYSMNILSLYLKRWIVEDLGRDGLYYDVPYAASMLLVALIMPAMGALSDHSRKKKLFLFLFTFSCCLATGLIPLIPLPYFMLIVVFFALSNFFYEGGMVFYNALLYAVSEGRRARMVSGFGVALGYLGAIVGMVLILPPVTGKLFGLDVPFFEAGGKNAAFLPTAILFFIFSLPLFFWVNEKHLAIKSRAAGLKRAYKDVWDGIRLTRQYPGVLRFLIADYFFEDAVATVILNIGIFSSTVIGFADADLTVFLIVSTVSAVIGSFAIGALSKKMVLKTLMTAIVRLWIIVLMLFLLFDNITVIYILGSLVGVLLGGLWTVSRPLLGEMVPENELGRFFGLYSLSGRAAAVVGPVVWGVLVYLFAPSRPLGSMVAGWLSLDSAAAVKMPYKIALFSLALMMAVGLYIFRKVPAAES